METTKQHTNIEGVMACPDCDLLFQKFYSIPGQVVSCTRCGHILYAPQEDSVDKTLALSLTGLILFLPANFLPIMTLDIMGIKGDGSIYDAIIVFAESGFLIVAIMTGLTSFLFPLIKLFLLFCISLGLKLHRFTSRLPLMMRWYRHLDEWGMLEVYMVGILVSIIKLKHMAHIQYNIGFLCFIGLLCVALAASTSVDAHEFWELIEKQQQKKRLETRA